MSRNAVTSVFIELICVCQLRNSEFCLCVCEDYCTDTIDYAIVIDQLSFQFFFSLGRLKDELKF